MIWFSSIYLNNLINTKFTDGSMVANNSKPFIFLFHQQLLIQSNFSLGVTQGKDKKWLLKTGDSLIEGHLHYTCILVQGTEEWRLFKTGDSLIEVTTYAGLTVRKSGR